MMAGRWRRRARRWLPGNDELVYMRLDEVIDINNNDVPSTTDGGARVRRAVRGRTCMRATPEHTLMTPINECTVRCTAALRSYANEGAHSPRRQAPTRTGAEIEFAEGRNPVLRQSIR